MAVLLHGAFGGWDELVIALVAFGVLWVAVKIAGRKAADADADEAADDAELEPGLSTTRTTTEEASDVAPPASRVG